MHLLGKNTMKKLFYLKGKKNKCKFLFQKTHSFHFFCITQKTRGYWWRCNTNQCNKYPSNIERTLRAMWAIYHPLPCLFLAHWAIRMTWLSRLLILDQTQGHVVRGGRWGSASLVIMRCMLLIKYVFFIFMYKCNHFN